MAFLVASLSACRIFTASFFKVCNAFHHHLCRFDLVMAFKRIKKSLDIGARDEGSALQVYVLYANLQSIIM